MLCPTLPAEAQERSLDDLLNEVAPNPESPVSALTEAQREARARWPGALMGVELGQRVAAARRRCREVGGSWERGRNVAACTAIPGGVTLPIRAGGYPAYRLGPFDGITIGLCAGRVCGLSTSSTGLCSQDPTGPLLFRALARRLGDPGSEATREGASNGPLTSTATERSWSLREGLVLRLLWTQLQVGVGRQAVRQRQCTTLLQVENERGSRQRR